MPGPRTDLSITRTGSPDQVIASSDITYTVIATNSGPSEAPGVSVDNSLPSGVTFKSANTHGNGTYDSLTGVWTIGSLVNGASAAMTLVVEVNPLTPTGTITNTSIVNSAKVDLDTTNNTATTTILIYTPPPVPGVKTKLAFGQQPTSTSAGATISSAVSVQIEDANGNVVTSDNSTAVTLAIGTNPGNGTLSGEMSVVATKGVTTFNGLKIDKAGTGYTLTAMSGTLTPAISQVFKVFHPGDANLDSKLNMGDVTKVERIILGLDPPTVGADANEDGKINMGDVTKIERIILGLDPLKG